MKIKLKNNKFGVLNEDSSINGQQNTQTSKQNQESEANKSFKEYRKKQYVQDQKIESLPVNIAVPDKLFRRLNVPNAPEDINNLMSTKQVNKARKTRDFKKLGIQDPIATYNHAEDECQKAFGNFFTQDSIKFSDSSKERKFGKTSGTTGKVYNESLNENNNLNEVTGASAFVAGAEAGTAVGKLAALGIDFCAGGLLGLTSGVAVPIGTLAVAAYGTAYTLEQVFGNATISGAANDKQAAHLTDERSDTMNAPTSRMPMEYGNVVEALDSYIENTLESVRELVVAITPANESKVDEIDKYVMGLKGAAVKAADQFMENNSQRIKDQLEAAEKKRASRVDKEKNRLEDIKAFSDALEKAFQTSSQTINKQSFKIYGTIKRFFVNNVSNSKGFELMELANEECKDFQKYIVKYNELVKKKDDNQEDDEIEQTPINTSATYNSSESPLYEADANMQTGKEGKPLIDLNAMYENVSSELIAKFKAAFSGFKSEEMKNYNSTKEQMQALIDAADKSINNKIEQITKVQNGESSATGGIGQAAKVFLMGHPLEANNLREVWSRHLVDLKSRMSNRLSQMTDSTNSERTFGWTLKFCRVTIPAILSRMLVYRYAYAILSNEGIYNYNEDMLKHDIETADKLVDTFVQDDTFKLVWLLNTYGKDYTNNDQSIISAENGEYKLTSETYFAYVIFLILKLIRNSKGITNNAELVNTYANVANTIANANPQDARAVIGVIYGMMPDKSKQLLSDNSEESIDALAALFTMDDDIKGVKEIIENTYKTITTNINSQLQNLDEDKAYRICQSLKIISENPENIYTIYVKHKQEILRLVDKYNQLSPEQKEEKQILEKRVKDIFKNINFRVEIKKEDCKIEVVKQAFAIPANNKTDYYSYILSLYGKKNLNTIKDTKGSASQTPKGITRVCEITSALIELALCGILVSTEQVEEKQIDIDEISVTKLYKDVKTNVIKYLVDSQQNYKIDNMSEQNEVIYNEYIKELNNLYKNIKSVANTKYAEYISKSKYVFADNIFEKDDEFKQLVNDIYESNDLNSIMSKFNNKKVKEIQKDKTINVEKEFYKFDHDHQLILFNDICKTFNSLKDNNDFKELKKFIDEIIKIVEDSAKNQ